MQSPTSQAILVLTRRCCWRELKLRSRPLATLGRAYNKSLAFSWLTRRLRGFCLPGDANIPRRNRAEPNFQLSTQNLLVFHSNLSRRNFTLTSAIDYHKSSLKCCSSTQCPLLRRHPLHPTIRMCLGFRVLLLGNGDTQARGVQTPLDLLHF
jgi:hypothetical protein